MNFKIFWILKVSHREEGEGMLPYKVSLVEFCGSSPLFSFTKFALLCCFSPYSRMIDTGLSFATFFDVFLVIFLSIWVHFHFTNKATESPEISHQQVQKLIYHHPSLVSISLFNLIYLSNMKWDFFWQHHPPPPPSRKIIKWEKIAFL